MAGIDSVKTSEPKDGFSTGANFEEISDSLIDSNGQNLKNYSIE